MKFPGFSATGAGPSQNTRSANPNNSTTSSTSFASSTNPAFLSMNTPSSPPISPNVTPLTPAPASGPSFNPTYAGDHDDFRGSQNSLHSMASMNSTMSSECPCSSCGGAGSSISSRGGYIVCANCLPSALQNIGIRGVGVDVPGRRGYSVWSPPGEIGDGPAPGPVPVTNLSPRAQNGAQNSGAGSGGFGGVGVGRGGIENHFHGNAAAITLNLQVPGNYLVDLRADYNLRGNNFGGVAPNGLPPRQGGGVGTGAFAFTPNFGNGNGGQQGPRPNGGGGGTM